MDIIKFSIENPVKVTVGAILVLLFGVIALKNIPIQLSPDIDRPVITVGTGWSGRSPEEIEESVILRQEEKLKSVQGLWKMTSTARLGRGFVKLEFDVGTDKTRALQEVSNRLDEVRKYPDDVDRPVIRMQDSASDDAVVYLMLQAEDPNFQVAEVYDFADRYIKPTLERIEGVSEIEVRGGRNHEVQVRFDPYALAQHEISPVELQRALANDNVNESAGDMPGGRLDYRFRMLGQYSSLEPIKKTVIKRDANGVPIRVEDVAKVELVLEKSVNFDQSLGQTSMSVFVKRETGSNVLKIIDEVTKRVDEMNGPDGMLANFHNGRYGLKMHITYEDSLYIRNAIKLVQNNLYTGGTLAVLCLLLFLRSTRPTLIIAIAIPISVVGTFVVLWLAGRNLNVISLAGLSFAIGMVMDNSIVVLENTDRHLAAGVPLKVAAYRAAKEVWGAILSSSLTTISVFAPILTIQDEAGQLFYDLSLAICSAVGLSLIVAITVVPTACSLFLHARRERKGVLKLADQLCGLVPASAWLCDKFADFIYMLMTRSFAGVWCRVMIISVITLGSIGLSIYLIPPASYLPDGNKNLTFGRVFVPPSYSLMQNFTIGKRLEDKIRPYWEAKNTEEASALGPVRDFQTGKEYTKIPALKEFFFVVSNNSVFMQAVSQDPENVKPIATIFTNAIKSIPGATGMASQSSIFGRGSGGSNSVSVEIFGDDLVPLQTSAANLQARLRKIFSPFAIQSQPQNFDEFGPEVRLNVDQVRAKDLNLSVSDLAASSRALIDGSLVGDFNFEGLNIDMIVMRDPRFKIKPDEFCDLPLSVTDEHGNRVILPIGEIVRPERSNSTQQIQRIEQQRSITLTVRPPQTMALEEAEQLIQEQVDDCQKTGEIYPGIRTRFSGNSDKLTQVRTSLLGKWTGFNMESITSVFLSRMFIALLITYLLMAALFENFVHPFVILFSVPMAAVGGFVGLALIRMKNPVQQLDVLTMLGFVILIGIVVNNAILLVHQALNYMRGVGEGSDDVVEPLPPREAIRKSVRTRIRPIFMTTSTSIVGMLPLVLSPGAGSELYCGLGSVVLGGLAMSTLFSLIVVPLMFSLVLDLQGKKAPGASESQAGDGGNPSDLQGQKTPAAVAVETA